MSKGASPRRAAQQWYSLQHMAWLLDFDVSTVRRWWKAGRFGPPSGSDPSDYWFTVGEGEGADVRISSRGYDFFVSGGAGLAVVAHVPVSGRTAGEARRALSYPTHPSNNDAYNSD